MASRARLRRLHDAIDEMMRSLDLEHLLRNAVSSACDLVTADAAAVYLPNSEGDALVIRAHDGLSESYAARQSLPMDEVRAAVASWDDDGVLTQWASCQAPNTLQQQLAGSLGIDKSKVTADFRNGVPAGWCTN